MNAGGIRDFYKSLNGNDRVFDIYFGFLHFMPTLLFRSDSWLGLFQHFDIKRKKLIPFG